MAQTFKEFYNQLDEGFFKNLASGALLGASLLGGVNQVDAAPVKPAITQNIQANNINYDLNQFARLWSKHYNAEKTDRVDWAKNELKTRTSLPNAILMNSINKAVKCFAGDEGVDADTLRKLLILTGRLESNYSASHLESKSGAKGYWQCLASTAQDRFKNGEPYFGNNFKRMFGKNALQQFKKLSFKQLQHKLKTDPDFCAMVAAAKWIEIANTVKNKQTKQLNSIFR